MTPDEVLEQAEEIIALFDDDPSKVHPMLDDLLCAVLRSLGYERLVNLYQEQERWFE